MNKFNAGDLSKKPSQVFESARNGGALIQHKDRSGKVVEEFYMTARKDSGHVSIAGVSDPLLVLNQNVIRATTIDPNTGLARYLKDI